MSNSQASKDSHFLVLRTANCSSVNLTAVIGLAAFKPPTDFRRHVLDSSHFARKRPHNARQYGVSVDVVKAAAESARLVIAEVNRHMPRALGDSFIHVDQIDYMVSSDQPILETTPDAPDEIALRIGHHIAELIEDGATMQLGIGTIPDTVLASLGGKKELGIHTEMFSDSVIDLVERE